MLAFLETNIVIYLVEKSPTFGARTAERVRQFLRSEGQVVSSELVRMEVRIGPLVRQDAGLLSRCDAFFENPQVRLVPITRAVCDLASRIRAERRYSAMDSLHLAAALEARCEVFLTNDSRLSGFDGLQVEVLSPEPA